MTKSEACHFCIYQLCPNDHDFRSEKLQHEKEAAAVEAASIKYTEATVEDMFYIGTNTQVEWPKVGLKTVYVMIPEEEFILCFRSTSQETVGGLKNYILQKKGVAYTNPVLSYQGKPVPAEDKLDDQDKKVFILSNGLFQGHGGRMWSCVNCINKSTGLMMGSLRKSEYDKAHSKPECALFMQKQLLAGKNAWGDNNRLDRN